MNFARIINHWENSGCDGRCEFCLYGESKDCTADIKKDTKALVKAYKALSRERDKLLGIKVVLLQDLEERDKKLEMTVEELYPEFMKDYKAMETELGDLYEEIDRLEKELNRKKEFELIFDAPPEEPIILK